MEAQSFLEECAAAEDEDEERIATRRALVARPKAKPVAAPVPDPTGAAMLPVAESVKLSAGG